jgi:rfaE bifunctional protein nucleotidyltransferase chain/domain/rfaE bifunctional protein kinase chain/domain
MSTDGPLVVVGDALLDCDLDGQVSRLCPDAPVPVLQDAVPAWRPGGAALAALLAATEEIPVVLVAPLGDDEASATVRALLEPHVTVISLPLSGTLAEKTRYRADGRTLLRTDRGGGPTGPTGAAGAEAAEAIAAAGTVLVSDYGRGVTADERIRAALSGQADRIPLVWDPHPRGTRPVPHTRLVTPNYAEAVGAAGQPAAPGHQLLQSAAAAAGQLSESWAASAVAVTLGERGCVLVQGAAAPLVIPAPRLAVTDPCGAGDRFAAAAAAALRQGALTSEAVTAATAAASSYLAAGGARQYSSPARTSAVTLPSRPGTAKGPGPGPAGRRPGQDAAELARRVRAAGGTVVATGGCFDLLHAGHVSLLQAARSLGDCLIVCLNSDASVGRLKGDGRPLNREADRVDVLAALGCVDAVTVFSEDTPCAVLERIRPDIWVKGGDYDGRDLPEAALLENWGGVAVTVPYLSGRSTTRLHAASVQAASLDGAERA